MFSDAGEAVADHRFGRAVHRRGIDQRAATIEEGLHHLGAGGAQLFVAADIEGDPGAQADGGNLLTRGRDRLFQDRPGAGPWPSAGSAAVVARLATEPNECAARQMIHGDHHEHVQRFAANGRCRCRGGPTASAPRAIATISRPLVAPSGQLAHAAAKLRRLAGFITKTAMAISLTELGLSSKERLPAKWWKGRRPWSLTSRL